MIPKAIREEIGIMPGDEVEFEPDGKAVRVVRVADDPGLRADEIKALRGAWADTAGGCTAALEEERRKERGLRSGRPRGEGRRGLAYADAFCIATARRLDSPLWTGDPEIVERADELGCEVVNLRVPGR